MKKLLVFLMLATLSACMTTKKVKQESHFKSDSSWTEQKPITINVTGGKTEPVNLDSLFEVLMRMKAQGNHSPIYIPDTSGKAMLRFWIDEAGRIRSDCEAKDQQYTTMVSDFYRVIKEQNSLIKTKQTIPLWVWVLGGILCAVLVIFSLLIIFLIKRSWNK